MQQQVLRRSSARCPPQPVVYPAQHQALIPAPPLHAATGWMDDENASGDEAQPLEHCHIFCNRTLDLASMDAIGFDMVCG